MSESEKKADRESVRVCIHCQKQITDISYKPEQYHIWIAGNVKGNAHCKLNPDYLKNHEPLAEPAEPSGGPMSREQPPVNYVHKPNCAIQNNKPEWIAVCDCEPTPAPPVPQMEAAFSEPPVRKVGHSALRYNKATGELDKFDPHPATESRKVQWQKRWEFCNKCGHDHCAGSEACADLVCKCGKTPTQIQSDKETIRQRLGSPELPVSEPPVRNVGHSALQHNKATGEIDKFDPHPAEPSVQGRWAKSIEATTKAEAIIRKIGDAACELIITRGSLVTADDEEINMQDTKDDLFAVLMGHDTGCLDPEELDETTCEFLWVESRLQQLITPSLPSPSDREQARYESPAACGHSKRYLTSSSPGASDVICAICRLTELERERDYWRDGFYRLQTLTVKARNLVGGKGEFRDRIPEELSVTNVDTPRAEVAESQVAVLRAALKDIYDFFMAPSACGDFTCYCGNPEVCGICEIRGQTEKLLALTPSPESTESESKPKRERVHPLDSCF